MEFRKWTEYLDTYEVNSKDDFKVLSDTNSKKTLLFIAVPQKGAMTGFAFNKDVLTMIPKQLKEMNSKAECEILYLYPKGYRNGIYKLSKEKNIVYLSFNSKVYNSYWSFNLKNKQDALLFNDIIEIMDNFVKENIEDE